MKFIFGFILLVFTCTKASANQCIEHLNPNHVRVVSDLELLNPIVKSFGLKSIHDIPLGFESKEPAFQQIQTLTTINLGLHAAKLMKESKRVHYPLLKTFLEAQKKSVIDYLIYIKSYRRPLSTEMLEHLTALAEFRAELETRVTQARTSKAVSNNELNRGESLLLRYLELNRRLLTQSITALRWD